MSALSEVGIIFVMTHDSIGLGEDGPTHQPVEHLASFRAMPNILTMRPCDGNETAGCYKIAVENRTRPSMLALSRQGMNNLPTTSIENVAKGGYTVLECDGTPDVIIIGTGSEVHIALDGAKKLAAEGIKARVVSMVCTELFDEQTQAYKDSVLPPSVRARVVVEAASSFGWQKYAGDKGQYVCVDTFGASAPANIIYEKYGITPDGVVAKAKAAMA